jgi:glyoxylase-like metal-dependent hydrolase (beta-lactamase superfamily II)/rhodanese-related sulfurtransferase
MIHVVTIDTADLGDRSYLVHDESVAVVIDPQRDVDRFLRLAARLDVRIATVLETHLHNDYVTGGPELARLTGADYITPRQEFPGRHEHVVGDGEEVRAGDVTLRCVATPGHTPHHMTYVLVTDDGVVGAFTGGSLLFGTTGRPDLISPADTQPLVRAQHASARRLSTQLPATTPIYPTHGFGSFCAVNPTNAVSSTLEREQQSNPVLTLAERDFADVTLLALGPIPGYYSRVGLTNAAGPAPIDLSPAPVADLADLQARAARGEWVVDLRPRAQFAAGHLPGTLGFDATGPFATYLAWLIRWPTPVTLLGPADVVGTAARQLTRVGIDRPSAVAYGGPEDWVAGTAASPDNLPIGYRRASFAELAAERSAGADLTVLDVRWPHERAQAHIESALHVPLNQLLARVGELPGGPLWVHCGTGFRASIAASLLHRCGLAVVLIDDRFTSSLAQMAAPPRRRATSAPRR